VTAAEVEKIRTAVVDLLLLIDRLGRGLATTASGSTIAAEAYQIALRLAPDLPGPEVGEE
jgi:hypothetical protein